MKMFELWLNAYQTKANPGNTVKEVMNPVFDHLSHIVKKISFFEGHLGLRSLLGQTLYLLLLLYTLDSYLSFDMHKAIV